MRKALILIIVLLVIAVPLAGASAALVHAESDRVNFVEQNHWGDYRAIEGAVVKSTASYNRKLVWETETRLGEKPVSETDYQYYGIEQRRPHPIDPFAIRTDIGTMFNVAGDMATYRVNDEKFEIPEEFGIYKKAADLYADLWASVKDGEEKEMNIKVSDYFEYYPFGNISDFGTYSFNMMMWDLRHSQDDNKIEFMKSLEDVFKIPIIEDETINIHASKNANGSSSSWGYGTAIEDNDGRKLDSYNPYTVEVYGDKMCYFTVNTLTDIGKTVDTSHLKYGYGIYAMPAVLPEYDSDTSYRDLAEIMPQVDKTRNIYPLKPGTVIHDLKIDKAKKKLLFLYEEESLPYLDVINAETGERLQKIKLTEVPVNYAYIISDDDYAVVEYSVKTENENDRWNNEYKRISVLSVKESGQYEIAFDCDRYNDERPYFGDAEYRYSSVENSDFDGERLIAVSTYRNTYRSPQEVNNVKSYDGCNYLVTVYDKTGLIYYGEYVNSLETGFEDRYDYFCHTYYYPPLEVNFE